MAAYRYSSSVLNSSTSTASQIDASLEQKTSGWVSYMTSATSVFNINSIKDLEIELPVRRIDIWDLLGVFEDLT